MTERGDERPGGASAQATGNHPGPSAGRRIGRLDRTRLPRGGNRASRAAPVGRRRSRVSLALDVSRVTGWLEATAAEHRLALRTTLAALITFALAHLLRLPQAYWAVLTSIIVMQASVGGSLKAGLDRMLGTVAGAVWGVSVTLAIPHRDSTLALGLALALAVAPLSLVAALKPNYRIAPVTAVIVLMSTTGIKLGPVHSALDRVVEIALGCVIGFAASLLILPTRAHGLLLGAAAALLLVLRDLTDLNSDLGDVAQPPDRATLVAAHQKLNQAVGRVESFVDEVNRERAHRLTDAPDVQPLARTLRRLRHDFTAIGRAVAEPLPESARRSLSEAARGLRVAISAYLAGAAAAVSQRRAGPSLEAVDTALLALRHALDGLRESGGFRTLDTDDLERLLSLDFAFQQLRANLGDLADRLAEHALSPSQPRHN